LATRSVRRSSPSIPTVRDGDALAVLRPIWATKTETASRVRQRVEAVLDSATVQKKRTGDNPARWRGHLAVILPKPTTVTKVENFAALPYAEPPSFMAALRSQGQPRGPRRRAARLSVHPKRAPGARRLLHPARQSAGNSVPPSAASGSTARRDAEIEQLKQSPRAVKCTK